MEMQGLRALSMLSLSVALGTAGVYLLLAPSDSRPSRFQRLPGFVTALLALLGVAWSIASLPLHDAESGGVPLSVSALIVLGMGSAAAAGVVLASRTVRVAILGFCALVGIVAGIFALQTVWFAALVIPVAGGAAVASGLTLRGVVADRDVSTDGDDAAMEPFLSSVAGGLLVLTLLTTLCTVAVAKFGVHSSNRHEGVSARAGQVNDANSSSSSSPDRTKLVLATVAIVILSTTSAVRWRKCNSSRQEFQESQPVG